MKKVLFTLAIVALASCSACCDSTSVDSLTKSVEAHADSLVTEVKK